MADERKHQRFPLSKLLWVYLVATGILAGTALAIPGLVTLGFFFFILPGLVLFFAPTAFLWGCIYAVAYWSGSLLVRPTIAALVALPLTGLVLWAIPQPSLRSAAETLSQYHLDDVMPAEPIPPQGDIRIDQRFANWDNVNQERLGFRAYSCDDRCLALLFEPGVRSVTMTVAEAATYETIRDGTSHTDDHSLTYRLLPKAQCGDRSLDPDLEHRRGYFGHNGDDNKAMVAEWGLKLTEDYCLIGDAPLNEFDMLIRTGNWRLRTAEEAEPSPWSLQNHETMAQYQEIRSADGAILFRRFNVETQALSAPLSIAGNFEGGGSLAIHFAWATQTLPTKRASDGDAPAQTVEAALAVQRTFDPQNGLVAARNALRTVLADPSTASGKAALPLIGNYMEILDAAHAGPEDLALLADLSADPRIHDLPNAWVLPRNLSAVQLTDLLPAVVHMLATAPEAVNLKSIVGERLEEWPPGAFANPSQEMRDLLADPVRRVRVTGLIARLSDMGTAGPPIVGDIMTWHADAIAQFNHDDPTMSSREKDQILRAHFAVIEAGRIAMCRLGRLASSQLPQMLAIEQDISPRSFERRDWDRMMLRLGRPLIEMKTPLSGSDEDYRERLATWLARFDEKSCQ